MKKLFKKLSNLGASEKTYYALNDLDKRLETYIDYDNGFYVELGANDGVTQSNSLYFEEERGWTGILIEPSPNNFLKCFERRGKKNAVFCNACVEFGYAEKFVEMTYANLMSVSLSMELDLEDKEGHVDKAQQHLKESEVSFTFGAVAKPLNDILIEGNAPSQMGLLSLDVEGAELNVLNGLDHSKFRFDYLLIECRDFDRLKTYLEKNGYSFKASLSHHDYLFRDTAKAA